MPINHKYKYDDADIQAILESRKKLIEDSAPNAFRKPVFVMAGVSNFEPGILKTVLELERVSAHGERILLIPCCLAQILDASDKEQDGHWVGILLEFDSNNNVEKTLCLDSLGAPVGKLDDVNLANQLSQVYPGQVLKKYICLRQSDATSCGSYMIENLLRHSLRTVNNQALNAEQLRLKDLESLRINRRDYYTVFYCKQSGKNVSDLQISKNPIIQQYIEQIQNNVESLTEIALSGMGLKDADLIPLLSSFLENPDAADRITKLDVSKNKLMNIDLSMFYNLADLSVANNKLTELDLSNSIKLTRLLANDNQLESISFHVENSITHLEMQNNNIKSISADNLRAVIAEKSVDNPHSLLNTELQFKVNAKESKGLNASELEEIQKISAAGQNLIPNTQYFKQLLFSDGSQCLVGYVNGHLRIKSEDIVDVTVRNAASLNSIDVVTNGEMFFEGANNFKILHSNVGAFEQADNSSLNIYGDDKIITVKKSENSEENTYTLSSSVKSNLVSADTKIKSVCVLKDFNVFSDKITLNEGANITGANCCFANSKREAVKPAKLDIIEEQVAAIKDKEPAANENDKPLEDGNLNNTKANSNTEPMSIDVHGKCIVDVLSIRAEKLNVSPTGVLNGVSKTDISASEDFWTTGRIEGKRIQLSAAYLMIMNLAYIFASLDINIDAPIGTFIIAGATLRAPKIFATTGCYVNLGGVVCAYEFSKNTLYPLDLGINLAWAPEKKSDLINPSKLLALAVRVASNVTKTIQPMLSTASVVGDMGYALYCLESKNPITNLINAGAYMAENGSYVFKSTAGVAKELYGSKDPMNLCKETITKKWNAMNIKDFFRLALATKGYVIAGKAILSKAGGAAAAANQLKKGAKALYIDGSKCLSDTKAAVSAEVGEKYAELKAAAPDRNTAMQAGKDFVIAKVAEVAGDALKPIVNAKNFISDPGTMSEKISAKASSIASSVTSTNLKKTLVDDQVEKIYKIQQDISNIYYENSFQDGVVAEAKIDATTEPEITTNPEPIKTESIPSPTSELGAEPVTPEETKVTEPKPVVPEKETYLYKDIFSDVLSTLGPSVRGSSLFGINSGITISGSVTEEALGHLHSGATYAARCDVYAHTFYNAGKYSSNQHNVSAQNYHESGDVDAAHRNIDVNNFTVNQGATFDAHKGVIVNTGNLDMHGKQKNSGGKVIVENDNTVHETGEQAVDSGLLHVKGNNTNAGKQSFNGGAVVVEKDNIVEQDAVQSQNDGKVIINGKNKIKNGAEQNLSNGEFFANGGSHVEKGARQNLSKMKHYYASEEQIDGARSAVNCPELHVKQSTVATDAKYAMKQSVQSGGKINFENGSEPNLEQAVLKNYDVIDNNTDLKCKDVVFHAKQVKNDRNIIYRGQFAIWADEKAEFAKNSSIERSAESSTNDTSFYLDAKSAAMLGGQKHHSAHYYFADMPSAESQDIADGTGIHANIQIDSEIYVSTESTDKINVKTYEGDIIRPRGANVRTSLQTNGPITKVMYTKYRKGEWKRCGYKHTDGAFGVQNGQEGYDYHGLSHRHERKKHGLNKLFNSEKAFKAITTVLATTSALFKEFNPGLSATAAVAATASGLKVIDIRDKKNDVAKWNNLVEIEKNKKIQLDQLRKDAKAAMKANFLANSQARIEDFDTLDAICKGDPLRVPNKNYLLDNQYAKNLSEIRDQASVAKLAIEQEYNHNKKLIEDDYQNNRKQIRREQNTAAGIAASINSGPTGYDANIGSTIRFQGQTHAAYKQVLNVDISKPKTETSARSRMQYEEEQARRLRAEMQSDLPRFLSGYTGPRPIIIQMAENQLENSRTEAIESWRPRVEFRALEDALGEEEKVSEPLFDQQSDFYEGNAPSAVDRRVFRENPGSVLNKMEKQVFGRIRDGKKDILNKYERDDRSFEERLSQKQGAPVKAARFTSPSRLVTMGVLALVPDSLWDLVMYGAAKPVLFAGQKVFGSVLRKAGVLNRATKDLTWQHAAEKAQILADSSFPAGSAGAAKVWSTKARLKAAQLPTKGKIRFIPMDGYKASNPIRRGPNSGYIDRFGNEWISGPSRTPGQAFEWDVQLSSLGKHKLGWASRDNKHVNVSLDGKLTHR